MKLHKYDIRYILIIIIQRCHRMTFEGVHKGIVLIHRNSPETLITLTGATTKRIRNLSENTNANIRQVNNPCLKSDKKCSGEKITERDVGDGT
jgi:hypothetical protein